ncbi:sensor histidine kinase [Chitinophagaceae bacterium LWZ2-11]
MNRFRFSGRTFITLLAILIAAGSIFYSQYLADKIAIQERKNVETWVLAQKTILYSADTTSLNLATKISGENNTIPIIETNERDSVTGAFINIDSSKVSADKNYLPIVLKEFKQYAPPIVLVLNKSPYTANKYYYGPSNLLKEVKYYPIVQLIIIALFIMILAIAQYTQYKSAQNQLWAGLAKETAHQLGTPVSSLQGWLEMLKEVEGNEKITPEIEKDINRLLLITDRFGKIGSSIKLEEENVIDRIENMIAYIKRRASGKVFFSFDTQGEKNITALISPPLFDWVIENLLKNALDAMHETGSISVTIQNGATNIIIDVTDTGKGISPKDINNVFKPGFSTKKRGWGLGLTLSKRIIEQYHKGKIFVKQSELGKGTTFRILLDK